MSVPVLQADSTYAAIEKKVRRLTASASEQALSSADIQQATNVFYNQDFPYAIKLDQMRSVYTFYTEPYRDRYPLDVNYNQGLRAPIYVEGIQGYFYKERDQFYNMWPRWPVKFQPFGGNGTQVNFNFTIQGPFLSREVVLGIVGTNGEAISVADDGNGNMQVQVPNSVVSVPAEGAKYVQTTPDPIYPPDIIGKPIPGMKNLNTLNPGLNAVTTIGTVNYVTGVFSLDFSLAGVVPAAGEVATLWVSQYQTGRPYTVLFWNNEIHVRPIPKLIHKIEIETYLTPVQFLQSTDSPTIMQWYQYIAYGVAMEILRERQDLADVEIGRYLCHYRVRWIAPSSPCAW